MNTKRWKSIARGIVVGALAASTLAACSGGGSSDSTARPRFEEAPGFQQVEEVNVPPSTTTATTPWDVTNAVVPWSASPCAELSTATLTPISVPFNWFAFATQLTANEALEACGSIVPAAGQEWRAISIRAVRQSEGQNLQATVVADGVRIGFESLELSSEASTYLLSVPEGAQELHLEYLVVDQRGLFDLRTNTPVNGHDALYANASGLLTSPAATYRYAYDQWQYDPECSGNRAGASRQVKEVALYGIVLSPFIPTDPADTTWQIADPDTAFLKVAMSDGTSKPNLDPAPESWFEFVLSDGSVVPGRYIHPPASGHLLEGVIYAEVPVETRTATLRIEIPDGLVSGGGSAYQHCSSLLGQTIEHEIGLG